MALLAVSTSQARSWLLHNELWRQLATLDRQNTASRAQCKYVEQNDCYTITLLNAEYSVLLEKQEVLAMCANSEPAPAEFIQQLCILAYLVGAKDIPPANRLVKAESFPDGEFFFRGPHELPTGKLAEMFGIDPSLLYAACEPLGADKRDFGDASVELLILPRVSVTLVVWAGDEEFSPRGSILFDQTACQHLALDALGAAVSLVIDAVVGT